MDNRFNYRKYVFFKIFFALFNVQEFYLKIHTNV